jgi:CheY-like chemotaxis protein
MLRRQGWNVTLASNGKEAYQRFLDGTWDLVLMDVQMPEMDGLEATRLIRREEHRRALVGPMRRTPIVAFTAHTSKPQHDQCLAEGMDGVITKPINLPALLQQIGEVMRIPAFAV